MKKNNVISNRQRRKIRRLIRENILDQRRLEEQRMLAVHEFKIAHQQKLEETGSLAEANLLLMEVDIMQALGFGSISGLKQQFVTGIIKDLGIPTNTLSGKFLVNLIENIEMKQIFALMGTADKCDAVVELLSKAALETITEYGAAKLIAYVFEKTAGKTSTVASGEIAKAMETFVGAIGMEVANDLIYQYFKVAMLDELAASICSGGIMGMISGSTTSKIKNVMGMGGESKSNLNVGDSLENTLDGTPSNGFDMKKVAGMIANAID
jgi:hypothetical protein